MGANPGNTRCLSLIARFRLQDGNEPDQTPFGIDGPWEFLLESAAPNRVLVLREAPMPTLFLAN